MPEISKEELAELRRKAAQADEADEAKARAEAEAEAERPPNDRFALLANGDRFEYSGAHPTAVAIGDREIPVIGVYDL